MRHPPPLTRVLLSSWLGASILLAEPLPRSTPERQGIPASAILTFVDRAEQEIDALHSFMLLRHGRVVAEGWWSPYNPDSPHELYSLSKSFTSTAVGLAIAEGHLSLDDVVLHPFPDDAPANPSNNLKSMRVRDLLCMSTGHESQVSSAADQISARSFLAHPVIFKPGTHFLYNTPATFMASALVQKATGQTVLDYLTPRLFEPLGITRPTWQTNSQGISLGGYGLSLRTEDIARFGQLYLQKGEWEGNQLVPSSWVESATARQTSNGSNPSSDWDQGYGFQFWRCRHGAYRGDGAFGQYCLIMPDQDAVLAITSGVRDMQAVLNLVWEELLPAMQPKRLPRDRGLENRLKERLTNLVLAPQAGEASSPLAESIASRTYDFPANDPGVESIQLVPDADSADVTIVLRRDGTEHRITCGHGTWIKQPTTLELGAKGKTAACGAWVEEASYLAKLCFYETPYTLTLRSRFAADEVVLDAEMNVAFGPTRQLQLVGRAR